MNHNTKLALAVLFGLVKREMLLVLLPTLMGSMAFAQNTGVELRMKLNLNDCVKHIHPAKAVAVLGKRHGIEIILPAKDEGYGQRFVFEKLGFLPESTVFTFSDSLYNSLTAYWESYLEVRIGQASVVKQIPVSGILPEISSIYGMTAYINPPRYFEIPGGSQKSNRLDLKTSGTDASTNVFILDRLFKDVSVARVSDSVADYQTINLSEYPSMDMLFGEVFMQKHLAYQSILEQIGEDGVGIENFALYGDTLFLLCSASFGERFAEGIGIQTDFAIAAYFGGTFVYALSIDGTGMDNYDLDNLSGFTVNQEGFWFALYQYENDVPHAEDFLVGKFIRKNNNQLSFEGFAGVKRSELLEKDRIQSDDVGFEFNGNVFFPLLGQYAYDIEAQRTYPVADWLIDSKWPQKRPKLIDITRQGGHIVVCFDEKGDLKIARLDPEDGTVFFVTNLGPHDSFKAYPSIGQNGKLCFIGPDKDIGILD